MAIPKVATVLKESISMKRLEQVLAYWKCSIKICNKINAFLGIRQFSVWEWEINHPKAKN